MALRRRQSEIEMVSQSQKRAEVVGSKTFRTKSKCIVNIHLGGIFAAITVIKTATRISSIVGAWMRGNPSSIHPRDCPHEPLSCEGRTPIPKGQRSIKIDGAVPLHCEERNTRWVKKYPTIPARHIRLPDEYTLVWKPFTRFEDFVNDRHGVRKSEFPRFITMDLGIDERIDPETQLATIGNRATPERKLLVDRPKRATEERKRELIRMKWTDKRPENQLFFNIVKTMFGILKSGRVVSLSVLGTGGLEEVDIPPERYCCHEFVSIEVRAKSKTPNLRRKGGIQQRDTGTIHIRFGSRLAFNNLVDKLFFVGWTRAPGELVTAACRRRWSILLGGE